jgi:hypothetical protein
MHNLLVLDQASKATVQLYSGTPIHLNSTLYIFQKSTELVEQRVRELLGRIC